MVPSMVDLLVLNLEYTSKIYFSNSEVIWWIFNVTYLLWRLSVLFDFSNTVHFYDIVSTNSSDVHRNIYIYSWN